MSPSQTNFDDHSLFDNQLENVVETTSMPVPGTRDTQSATDGHVQNVDAQSNIVGNDQPRPIASTTPYERAPGNSDNQRLIGALVPYADGHSNYVDDDLSPSAISANSGDHRTHETHLPIVAGTPSEIDQAMTGVRISNVDLAPLINDIIAEHMRRQAAIKAQRRLDQAAGAMARRLCGWSPDLDEKERKRLNTRAENIVAALEKGHDVKAEDELVAEQLLPFIHATLAGRAPFDTLRKNAEKVLAQRAKHLPVWPWIDAIRGADAGGLAALVGEAGDLLNYATPAKLWKRLGLAVMSGQRQGNPGKAATAEDWIRHGYSGRRRSIVWNIGHALVMCNKDGKYRTIYLERKAYEHARAPEMSKGHASNRAQRYMEKRFVRDLWSAWRAAAAAAARGEQPSST